MDASDCPGCRERNTRIAELEQRVATLDARLGERDTRIAELEQRVAALQAQLGTNSTNSSLPPSANPLGAPKPVVKKKSGRKPGGQPNHPPHLKQLLPPERVTTTHVFVPPHCEECRAALPAQAQPSDPEPTRFQTIELPVLVAEVTEYQGHARTCPDCGHVTWAAIPQEIRAHSVEPRLTATLSYLSGCHGLSKRAVEEIAEAVFAAPVALGTVANLEQEMSAALEAPHQEALTAVRTAEVKHADETSWKQAGKLRWLWGAATARVAAFTIHAQHGALGLAALLGATIYGILCTDRLAVYEQVLAEYRQVCWAHLKRDFQKLVDRGGASVRLGREGLVIVRKVFAAWHAFQDGACTRAQLEDRLAPVVGQMSRLLSRGQSSTDPSAARFCANVQKVEVALWTFVVEEGVEPTNNFMERLLRRAVLWRKRSFGCWSEAGCRFVERILTVVQTRRLQRQNVLEYLHNALLAHRNGQPCPPLVSAG
jgi:transposase